MRNILLYTDDDGIWIAEVPSLPGCHAFGITRDEALVKIKGAIESWIEAAHQRGQPIPNDFQNIEIVSAVS